MAVREITVVGHRALHQRTRRVKEVTDELRTLVEDMFDTMEAADGVGLAANQVGVRLRVFVYDVEEDGEHHHGHVINPVLTTGQLSPGPADADEDAEGCLSVPGEGFPLKRADWARVTGTDLDGNPVELEGTGLFARCLQHETDHLDGRLYTDRLAGAWRKQAQQAIKERGWERDRVTRWDPATQKPDRV
ncbi:MAG TPA: peptide deformylase [Segeticoccus sp.]|nr:peptide deformylase [Segeticoccus sp.]